MEPAQKRQRCETSPMQRIGSLPREVQAKILLMAIETPSAALVKAAIGDRYGDPGWWATKVGRDRGYQRFLNYHTPCLRLWARALEVLPDGSLAWKWSRTNVFMNKSGGAYVRGTWDDLANEMAIKRNVRRRPPVDKYLHEGYLRTRCDQLIRALYVNVTEYWGGSNHVFRYTSNKLVLTDLASGNCRLDWNEAENWRGALLYDIVELCMERTPGASWPPAATSHGRWSVKQY